MSYIFDGFSKNSEQFLNNFINVDLHIHSIFSKYKEGKIKRQDGSEIGIVDDSDFSHIDVLLKKLNDNNINMFAFTDHNRFSQELYENTCEIIETSGKYNNIKCLLPGVEFDVKIEDGKKNCHIITIFDAKNHNDLVKIETAIMANPLTSKNDYYSLIDFENLMKSIGLNTIFIACQRKDLDNPSGGANCISNSVSDVYEFLKVGFINALEYQKSNVEGMLLNNLEDFPREMGLVCGSDCHQWEAYPLHDETDKNTSNKRFFTIKALPTFLGLLLAVLSPKTRFRRKKNDRDYYDGIMKDNERIPLSSGINVIIGENGSGKSTLLQAIGNEKLESYQKKLLKNNCIQVDTNSIAKEFVCQNQIIKESNNSEKLFSDSLFSEVDNTIFEKETKLYANALYEYICNKIKLRSDYDNLKKSKLVLDPDLYYSKTFYIDVNISQLKTENDIYKNHLNYLNNILDNLKNELMTANIYDATELSKLKMAYNQIADVRNSIALKYKKLYLKNEVINIIIEKVKAYKKSMCSKSNEEDEESATYKNLVNGFKSSCSNYINVGRLTKYSLPSFKLDLVNSTYGLSENKNRGYKFYKKTKYFQKSDVLDEFYKAVFNTEYRSLDKLKNIFTVEELAKAITGANINNYKDTYGDKVKKYIAEEEKTTFEVLEASSQKKMGNTLGEKSLVYYKYLTSEENKDYKILYIDQPEDNISNIRIASDLITYLSDLRNNKQIIFVTHNPLLVINLDVDNVIIMENKGGKISINSGCLEHGDNLKKIAGLLDGGKELIEKRLKLYYGRENH